MDLITLIPRIDVDPAQCLRSPGAVLLHDYLAPKRMSAMRLARLTGIRAAHLGDIIAGTRRLTFNEALRLSAVFGTSGFYWLALQARCDLVASREIHRTPRSAMRQPSA
jgi:antitoxin HigA-1